MGTGEFNAGGNQGGVEIFLVASCYRNQDMLRPGGPLGSYADLTFYVPCERSINLIVSTFSGLLMVSRIR